MDDTYSPWTYGHHNGFIAYMTTTDIKCAFGNRIKLLRKNKGLSQEDLALASGLDRTYIGGVERGERNVSIVNIKRIADALAMSLAEIFNEF